MGQSEPIINVEAAQSAFGQLLEVMGTLLAPNGCAWDREQTAGTLFPYLLEETWEAYSGLAGKQDPPAVTEELGDVFYTLLFLMLAYFKDHPAHNVERLLTEIRDKMVRRHPHVFGDLKAPTAEEALTRWDQIKAAEGKADNQTTKRYRKVLARLFSYLQSDPKHLDRLESYLDQTLK